MAYASTKTDRTSYCSTLLTTPKSLAIAAKSGATIYEEVDDIKENREAKIGMRHFLPSHQFWI